jgi:hypothetical protein
MQKYIIIGLCAALLTLLWLHYRAIAEKESALADKAALSVVVDAQSEVINAMHEDARLRDRALAERDKTINSLNVDALEAMRALGAASYEHVQNCDLDAPLPASLSAPLLLLHRQATGGDRATGDQGDGAAVAVPASALPGAAVSNDDTQSRAMGGQAAGMGR